MMDVETNKMGLGEIFSVGFSTYFQNFKDMIIIGLLFMIPYGLVTGLLTPLSASAQATTPVILVEIVFGLLYIAATVGMMQLSFQRLKGKPVDWKQALSFGWSKWFTAFVAMLGFGLAILGLSILLIIPAIIFGIYWIFVMYAVIFREKGLGEAMKYSKEMVKNRWWRTLGFQLSIAIVLGIAVFIITIPLGIMLLIPGLYIVALILLNLLNFVFTGIMISIMTVLFLNWDKHRVER